MPRLSKNNEYAILWLNSQGQDVSYIAKELKLSKQQVENTLSKFNTDTVVNTNTDKSIDQTPKTAKDFMIRHSQNNINNVSIMTQQASMMADETRKLLPNNTTSPFHIKKS